MGLGLGRAAKQVVVNLFCCTAYVGCWQILLQKSLLVSAIDDSLALTRFAAEEYKRDRWNRLADVHAPTRHVRSRAFIRSGVWPVMSKHVPRMSLDDAAHFSPEKRQQTIASYPEHERDARTKGIPALGSGLVFPISDDDYRRSTSHPRILGSYQRA
jgi:hypothetical protein